MHAHATFPWPCCPCRGWGWAAWATRRFIRETADELGVPLVDAGLADLLARRDMRSDAVHLNAGGYRAMAARVADSLAKLGWLRRD